MQNSSPFGDLHIPKRRRTSLGKVRNRNWSSSFSDSHEKEVSLQNDEFEVAQTLGMLATGAAFQQDDPEVQVWLQNSKTQKTALKSLGLCLQIILAHGDSPRALLQTYEPFKP